MQRLFDIVLRYLLYVSLVLLLRQRGWCGEDQLAYRCALVELQAVILSLKHEESMQWKHDI